jgi:iron complex transport system ATP-binding protein
MKLTINNLCAGYNGRQVLHNISESISTGDIVCLLGPNGSGKTTLFKTILDLIPSTGDICLDGKHFRSLNRRERARTLAYIPQIHIPPFPYTAFDVVLTGRTPFFAIYSSPSKVDRQRAEEALALVNISYLAKRNYAQLSGGERQLVLIARALAQAPRFLIMDEPTSHLDYGNQLRTIQTIRRLAKYDMGIILTTHVPDHAFMCSSRVIALRDGRIEASGIPQEVLTPSVLYRMYGVEVDIISLPFGRCVCATAEGAFV